MSVSVANGKQIVVDAYHIPAPLKEYDAWVVWSPDLGKTVRAPWQCGHMYPAEWAEGKDVDPRVSYDKASSVASMPVGEIGRTWPFPDDANPDTVKPAILIPPASADNDLLFVDFDDVRDPETGQIPNEVWDILKELGGYVEVSSSGEGLHVWVRAELPEGYGKFIEPLDGIGQLEMYDRGRMTGGTWHHVRGTPQDKIPEAQDAINRLVAKYETQECPECSNLVRARNVDDADKCPACGSDLEVEENIDRSYSEQATVNAGSDCSPYYDLSLTDVADTGAFRSYRDDSRNPAPGSWQGPHPKHGGTTKDDKKSTNFNVDDDEGVWHCFAHDSGGGPLSLIAVLDGIVSCSNADRVHANRETLLRACLAARDRFSALEGETPPYEALVAVAEWADLSMADRQDGILGESAYRYSLEIYAELSRSDL